MYSFVICENVYLIFHKIDNERRLVATFSKDDSEFFLAFVSFLELELESPQT